MAGSYRENRDPYSDRDEEQSGIVSMLITLACLVASAALICTVVWAVTHRKSNKDPLDISMSVTPSLAETLMNDQTSSGTETGPEKDEDEDVDPINGDVGMAFNTVEEEVTAKDVAVLRSVPNTDGINTVLGQLQNGQTVKRVGINKQTGWSKVIYRGQEVFAVTYTLTKDLEYRSDDAGEGENRVTTADGRVIIFKNCEDTVTAKEVVNLRTEPSTTQGAATVSCQLSNGEKAKRTGFSADSGWSRVEYNGKVLYVVSSYIQEVGD